MTKYVHGLGKRNTNCDGDKIVYSVCRAVDEYGLVIMMILVIIISYIAQLHHNILPYSGNYSHITGLYEIPNASCC